MLHHIKNYFHLYISFRIFHSMLQVCLCIIGTLLLIIVNDKILAQRLFSCTSIEFCNDGIDIDPRIETPRPPSEKCPPGYVNCLDVKCGVATNKLLPGTQNGIATSMAFPWHAFIQDNDRKTNEKMGYAGGGVLINQYFVLTAAHKIANLSSVNVIMGLYNLNNRTNTQISAVDSIFHHADYSKETLRNDIALLHLKTPINLNDNVNVMCLPQEKKDYQGATSKDCVVSGFGQIRFTDYAAPTPFLKQVHVGIVKTQDCKKKFAEPTLLGAKADYYLDDVAEICAGGQEELDACTQDGGSPLVCLDANTKIFSLVGLVIWGKKCGLKDVFGVYLNVPQYITWIKCTQNCTLGMRNCADCKAIKYI